MIVRIVCASLLFSCAGFATAQEPLLQDRDGSGSVAYMAFGDSITYGVGDGVPGGATGLEKAPHTDGSGGYPARLRTLLGIVVINQGAPGERLVDEGGEERFPRVVSTVPSDLVGIMEGVNDAIKRMPSSTFARAMQRMINVARALGREPVLLTTPLPCCGNTGKEPYVGAYNSELRRLAQVNRLALADNERAWKSSCAVPAACFVFPEGLHPNSFGYDVMAQTVAAALVGIDVFAEGGAAELEAALSLPAGSIVVRPDTAEGVQ